MGYYIDLRKSTAKFKIENAEKILRAIQKLRGQETTADGNGRPHFSWVDDDFHMINDIRDMFDEWQWEIIRKGYHYYITGFSGEKLGDEYILFNAIAPYMEKGFIEIQGEGNELWRWVFRNKKLYTVYPTIMWNERIKSTKKAWKTRRKKYGKTGRKSKPKTPAKEKLLLG